MIVVRTIPFDKTEVCVSWVSWKFQPLLELSAARVSQGTIVDWAMQLSMTAKKKPQRIRQG
jgi:hypothetical protein